MLSNRFVRVIVRSEQANTPGATESTARSLEAFREIAGRRKAVICNDSV
jgi:hypothetical protein